MNGYFRENKLIRATFDFLVIFWNFGDFFLKKMKIKKKNREIHKKKSENRIIVKLIRQLKHAANSKRIFVLRLL